MVRPLQFKWTWYYHTAPRKSVRTRLGIPKAEKMKQRRWAQREIVTISWHSVWQGWYFREPARTFPVNDWVKTQSTLVSPNQSNNLPGVHHPIREKLFTSSYTICWNMGELSPHRGHGEALWFLIVSMMAFRMCVDYCRLNQRTVKDAQPLPRPNDLLQAVSGASWFSCLDLVRLLANASSSQSSTKDRIFHSQRPVSIESDTLWINQRGN